MTLTVSTDPKTQIMETSEALVKEMPSLKKLGKEMEAAEAAVEKQLAAVRKEAEKVKGGEDRVEEIIAAKLRDMNLATTHAAHRGLTTVPPQSHGRLLGRRPAAQAGGLGPWSRPGSGEPVQKRSRGQQRHWQAPNRATV